MVIMKNHMYDCLHVNTHHIHIQTPYVSIENSNEIINVFLILIKLNMRNRNNMFSNKCFILILYTMNHDPDVGYRFPRKLHN